MMNNESQIKQILEPVYLNEKMVLNAAAYLFKGITFEESISRQDGKEKETRAIARFLKFLELSGDSKTTSGVINQSKKEYTKAAIHMDVVDKLKEEKLISFCDLSTIPSFRSHLKNA